MIKNKIAYCNECEDAVDFYYQYKMIEEEFKGEIINYWFRVGICKCCNNEVATDIDYNSRKSKARLEAYKKRKGIIDLKGISEIIDKYDIGKESLADIAGFGKVTIKRYYEGFIPSKDYSDVLVKILHNEDFFMSLVERNKERIKDVAYRKIISRYENLLEIGSSKILQIANYIITHMDEVTPLALEKLLAFSNGVNYALNGKQLIFEECQAWAHGPVYPVIYNKYKKYGYKPIDNGIYSTSGCIITKLSEEEIKAIDLVISTFGIYSPKTLECISHSQDPWIEKRDGYEEGDICQTTIDEESVKRYYINHNLNSEETIQMYIESCIQDYNMRKKHA